MFSKKFKILAAVLVVIAGAASAVYFYMRKPTVELKINYEIFENLDGFHVEYPEWKESKMSDPNILISATDDNGAQLTISQKYYDVNATAESIAQDLSNENQKLFEGYSLLEKKIVKGDEIDTKASFRLSGFQTLSFNKGFMFTGQEQSNKLVNISITVLSDKSDDYQSIIKHVFDSAVIKNILVFRPVPNEEISSPLTVKGRARVFENTVAFRIKDSDGKVLLTDNVMTNAPDAGLMGDFTKELYFSTDKKEGVLEVFWASPKDGSDLDKVAIPLKFK